jgi:hypothetical protein
MAAKLKRDKKLKVLEYYHWQCMMPRCLHPDELGGRVIDKALAGSADDWRPSVDHKIRRCDGGTNTLRNLRAAHWLCNAADAARLDRLAVAGVRFTAIAGAEAVKALLGLRDTL